MAYTKCTSVKYTTDNTHIYDTRLKVKCNLVVVSINFFNAMIFIMEKMKKIKTNCIHRIIITCALASDDRFV